jgi:hypothetical protein
MWHQAPYMCLPILLTFLYIAVNLRSKYAFYIRSYSILLYLATPHRRGVLGNKCAGHHNLKTVQIREVEIKYMENPFLHIKASES